jgi:2-dehydro-3-deoxy-D-arabinonate dehydratase
MRICRFEAEPDTQARIGLIQNNQTVLDLSPSGIHSVSDITERENPASDLANPALPSHQLTDVRLLSPIDQQEVWAAGVTYLRSKNARMEESDFSASAYDQVYDAPRPEIFFKSLAEKTVSTNSPVGIRSDGKWNVPEPELALIINSRGTIVGYTIGNDMSSRDIEGENLLYLPQAKVYKNSCALGPVIVLGTTEEEARKWSIGIRIERAGENVFTGDTSVSQIKRSFSELADYLFRSQEFPHGAVLLTGTGVVPPDEFTLADEDIVSITISGIGELANRVITV